MIIEQGGDWRSVVDGIRPFSQQIWQRLSIQRDADSSSMHGLGGVHRHRMAPEVESRISAAIASSPLTVMAAKLCGIESGEAAPRSVTGGAA
jgi:uncharacterized NAD(P)/FAD-binding protein YdhS